MHVQDIFETLSQAVNVFFKNTNCVLKSIEQLT